MTHESGITSESERKEDPSAACVGSGAAAPSGKNRMKEGADGVYVARGK
jgi:hypothetical protein